VALFYDAKTASERPEMLSIPHLIIIFVVALVVFGPENLPELARNLGKVMAEFKRATGDLRSTFEGHMRDLEREADSRRIGGSTAAPGASSAAPHSSAGPAPGTVPTLPPQLGVPIEGQSAAPAESVHEVRFQQPQTEPTGPSEAAEPGERKSESAAETIIEKKITETTSDGGTRPA
jgi:sec-independent protein translocase protein TatB